MPTIQEVVMLILRLINDWLRENNAAQVGNDVGVYRHFDKTCVGWKNIDELKAHGFDIEAGVLAQVEQDLQTLSLEEKGGEIGWAGTMVVFSLIEQEYFKKLQHL